MRFTSLGSTLITASTRCPSLLRATTGSVGFEGKGVVEGEMVGGAFAAAAHDEATAFKPFVPVGDFGGGAGGATWATDVVGWYGD